MSPAQTAVDDTVTSAVQCAYPKFCAKQTAVKEEKVKYMYCCVLLVLPLGCNKTYD